MANELFVTYPSTLKVAEFHLRAQEVAVQAPAGSGAGESTNDAALLNNSYPPEVTTLDQLRAEQLWEQIKKLPAVERPRAVRRHGQFKTPALFVLLQRQYLEAGRDNRQRGVEIAELVIESVRALAVGSAYDQRTLALLEAEAWSCVGNAKRLVLDLGGAERAFCAAEARLPEDPDPGVYAGFLHLKATLRWDQRQTTEALDLENKAVAIFPGSGDPQELAKYLGMRAYLHHLLENAPAALADIQQALQATTGRVNHLRYSLVHISAIMSLDSKASASAEQAIAEAKKLAEVLGSKYHLYSVVLLEGRLDGCKGDIDGCLQKLAATRAGFLELKYFDHAAMVSLEMAIILADRQRSFEASLLSAELIPLLDSLSFRPEARAARAQLKKCLEQGTLTKDVLLAINKALQRSRQNPTISVE